MSRENQERERRQLTSENQAIAPIKTNGEKTSYGT